MSHHFSVSIQWTGNTGTGTSGYTDYERSHVLIGENKMPLACSSASVFRGDGTLYNPEDMLLYSVAACHMLWFLHCCADAGVVVTAYTNTPEGYLANDDHGIGRFTEIILHPIVELADDTQRSMLEELHALAHTKCFIANSLNSEVRIELGL